MPNKQRTISTWQSTILFPKCSPRCSWKRLDLQISSIFLTFYSGNLIKKDKLPVSIIYMSFHKFFYGVALCLDTSTQLNQSGFRFDKSFKQLQSLLYGYYSIYSTDTYTDKKMTMIWKLAVSHLCFIFPQFFLYVYKSFLVSNTIRSLLYMVIL